MELRADRAVTAVLTRECADVDCSGDAMLACLAGTCVDWSCTPETPEQCPTPECIADTDCPAAPASCAAAACVAGSCLYTDVGFVCGGGSHCVPDVGCCDAAGRCADDAAREGHWALATSPDTVYLAFDVAGAGHVDGDLYASDSPPSDLYLQAREPDGETIRWTRRYATGFYEWANALAVTSSGDVVIGGVAKSSGLFGDVPLDVDDHDGFVAVLAGADGEPRWAQGFTVETLRAEVVDVAAGPDGSLFALATFEERVTVGSLSADPPSADVLGHAVVGFAPTGATWTPAWLTTVIGEPRAIAASRDGVWVVGWAEGSLAVDASELTVIGSDAFAALLDPATGAPSWVRTYGGDGWVRAYDVAIDSMGGAHLIGSLEGADGVFGSFTRTPRGAADIVLLGLDATGEPVYAELAGGPGYDEGHRITYSSGSDSLLWTAVTDAPFTYSGRDIGDPDAMASLVSCVSDPGGNPRGSSTYALGASTGEWQAPWSLVITPSLRGCMVGLAPRDYPTPFFLGNADTIHYSCADL
ncbi:MAG: hypothetical protein R3B82_26660 [Sandaracinaceae bacterium]